MNNLPITGNATQTSSNATNAANSTQNDDPVAGLFAALLAQQIGGNIAGPRDGVQFSTDEDCLAKDLEQDVAIVDARGDPSNVLAAMMMQFPQEVSAKGAHSRAAADVASNLAVSVGRRNSMAIDNAAINAATLADTNADITTLADANADIAMLAPAANALGGDALKLAGRMDISANLNQLSAGRFQPSAEQSQLSASTTQTLTVAVSAAMPNILTGNHVANNSPQIIDAPLGSAGWAEEFSQKISWMGTQQNQVAELHLNPPNLGPLNVVLKISDNQATALFTSPHGAVRDAIENALPKLREILADNGITLGGATVSDQPPRDRSAEGSMNHGHGANVHRTMDNEESVTPDQALKTVQNAPMRRHNGMVDTFA